MSINNFSSIQIGLASPQRILEWSRGEVKKPETINYRSQKPERDGLFCEKIFGPSKDWECFCGKYKKVRYKGVVCDRCGVEVTKSSVRRERMGHIHLAAPVAHIWYLRGIPSRMSLLLNISPKHLEEVVYFVSWVVINAGDTDLEYKEIISEEVYRTHIQKYGVGSFTAKTGAEAVQDLLKQIDLDKEYDEVRKDLESIYDKHSDKRKKLIKRLETIEAFRSSDNQPEWMVMTELPVIPPDLRPMLQLDGGRFATSDLNDLYRRVITRNNRLHKLIDMGTPAIIVQNEKRMLQEAVDALIDNGRRSKPIVGAGSRALKSLSHSLKGKQGRFRQNLLGKRVDFSGRSVIAVGPDLKMFECGIPREMAIQLFKPFVINELVVRQISNNPKSAEKLIERQDPRVWDVVEDVIRDHPVLLNRAPTLHRLGIQAFKPKLVEGRAIRLHPLVTPAFNADFDGDQMAVHVPLSEESRAEAEVLMLGSNNILGPKDGKPIVTPSQDMVMGNFYLNMEETASEFLAQSEVLRVLNDLENASIWKRYAENEGHIYRDINEAVMAYESKEIHLHTRISVRAKSLKKTSFTEDQNRQYLVTTVGKLIFNEMFPNDFPYINEVSKLNFKQTPSRYFVPIGENVKQYIESLPISADFKKKDLGLIISEVFNRYGTSKTSQILDNIKDNGFKYSTIAGMTVALSDIVVSPNTASLIEQGKIQEAKLMDLRSGGRLTPREWERHITLLWDRIKGEISKDLELHLPRKNPINMMKTSGARGNASHFTQLAGIRGLMGKPISAIKVHTTNHDKNIQQLIDDVRKYVVNRLLDKRIYQEEINTEVYKNAKVKPKTSLEIIEDFKAQLKQLNDLKDANEAICIAYFIELDIFEQIKHFEEFSNSKRSKDVLRKKAAKLAKKLRDTTLPEKESLIERSNLLKEILNSDGFEEGKLSLGSTLKEISTKDAEYRHFIDDFSARYFNMNAKDINDVIADAKKFEAEIKHIEEYIKNENPFIYEKAQDKDIVKIKSVTERARALLVSGSVGDDEMRRAELYKYVRVLFDRNHPVVTKLLKKSDVTETSEQTTAVFRDIVAKRLNLNDYPTINKIRLLCEVPVDIFKNIAGEDGFIQNIFSPLELSELNIANVAYIDEVNSLLDAKYASLASDEEVRAEIKKNGLKKTKDIFAKIEVDSKRKAADKKLIDKKAFEYHNALTEDESQAYLMHINNKAKFEKADYEAKLLDLIKSFMENHPDELYTFIKQDILNKKITERIEFNADIIDYFYSGAKDNHLEERFYDRFKMLEAEALYPRFMERLEALEKTMMHVVEKYVAENDEPLKKYYDAKNTGKIEEEKYDAVSNLAKAERRYIPSVFEVPIYSSFRKGLNVSEFFISTHGVRKGLTDTALKTAESGYLTRRLVDVAQDVMITDMDCGTDRGYLVEDFMDRKSNTVIEDLKDRLIGRYSKEDVINPKTGEVLVESDEYISEDIANEIVDAGVRRVLIRNIFTCDSTVGVCAKCYGRNLATGKAVEMGEAIGIMAAQSIGEPGTQLTMRTFHTGGVAAAEGGDITQGLPRVEELFEARRPKRPAILAKISGTIFAIESVSSDILDNKKLSYYQDDTAALDAADKKKELYIRVDIKNDVEQVSHFIPLTQHILKDIVIGKIIEAGENITDDHIDPKELLEIGGLLSVENYIMREVKKVYQSQGIEISDKHLEVMIRQMLRKVVILDGGDTRLSEGVQMSVPSITKINEKVLVSGKRPALFRPILMGISKSSVETDSFLSAASFQETTKVLTDASIKGKIDHLTGLKENVIIGKRIPAGTGCHEERESSTRIKIITAELIEIREEKQRQLAAAQDASRDFNKDIDRSERDDNENQAAE